MRIKEIILAILGILLPILYQAITNADPSFPLTQEGFVTFLLYLIGLPFGGWQVLKMRLLARLERDGEAKLGARKIH